MFSSTIIPTVNRSTLGRAVHSVLDQAFTSDRFEVIVVNDSGQPLSEWDWTSSPQVRVVDTNRRERGFARNTGAAVARGEYLHFLDDDDVILPGALQAFWDFARRAHSAVWLYGSWRTVDNNGSLVEEFRPGLNGNIFPLLIAGESLPLQASLVRASTFFEVGGFDATPLITGVEDRDLGRRLALAGDIGHVDTVVAQIRIGEETSTTNWARTAERDRWGRERALSAHQAFARLRAAPLTAYWRGRATRAYFASTVWNLQRGNLLTATSRAVHGLAIASWQPLRSQYWQGLSTKIK